MSTNHYGHIPPPQMNLHSNKQKPDYGLPPNANIQWSATQPKEFENRDKYMAQGLTDEHYNNYDTNANQNELPDDEPCPPPDLKRLVTGQTVSLDDGLNSPPFDRVVPGEGNVLTNYPPAPTSTISERFVSGSGINDYNPVPPNLFVALSKKNDAVSHNNNFQSENNNIGQNFFDSYLGGNSSAQDDRPTQQPQMMNKHHPFNAFSTDKSHQEMMPSKVPSAPVFDLANNRNANSPFQNYQNWVPQQQLQPVSNKPLMMKTGENTQYDNSFQSRASMPSDVQERQYNEDLQPRYDQEKRRNYSYEVSNNTSVTKHENYFASSQNVDQGENNEQIPFNADRRKDDQRYRRIPSANRMAVEGASDNIPYAKPIPSSTPVLMPNYEDWYRNNPPQLNQYTEYSEPKNIRNSHPYPNEKIRDEKILQNAPQQAHMSQFTPATIFPNSSFDTTLHSKTPSMSSNTSSVNEISSYQHIETDTTDRAAAAPKLYDQMDTSRLNEGASNDLKGHELKTGRNEPMRPQTIEQVRENYEAFEVEDRGGYNGNKDFANVENLKLKKEPPFTFGAGQYANVAGAAMTLDVVGPKDGKVFRNNNSMVKNHERPDGDAAASRGTVPGAQSTPTDNQSRSFSNSLSNVSMVYSSHNVGRTEDDGGDIKENSPCSDSDEHSMDQRQVTACNNYNTVPGRGKNSSKLAQGTKSNKKFSNKIEPPLETRMVVGETSSDVPKVTATKASAHRSHHDERCYEEDKGRKADRDRMDTSRRKAHSGKSRREYRSDEDEDRPYEPRSHAYDHWHRASSPPRRGWRPREDLDSSYTQDESYSEYENYDYDDYAPSKHSQASYSSRMPSKKPNYDSRVRNSRPSSRSGSEFRHERSMWYNSEPRSYPKRKPKGYEYLDHRYVEMSDKDYKYGEDLRKENPQKYCEWFNKNFPVEYKRWYDSFISPRASYQADRRGSGHSAHSSVNNDSMSMNDERLLLSIKELSISRSAKMELASIHEHRRSPFKFPVCHVKGLFNALGQLVVVKESSPQEHEPTEVDLYRVLSPDDDPDVIEFVNFTGPFVVCETHPNTISEFVLKHAEEASTSSERLLYLLIDLIIRLRGVTDGIAISELLMNSYRNVQKYSPVSPKDDSIKQANQLPILAESEILEKYTDLLLQGNKSAALDCAVNNKLWGHAFLLASKMGNKYYSNVLAKFDSSIPINHPLKTLYQLYSNQIPQAATACSDEKWGDWRPHLAMILSNPMLDNGIDKTAIIALGDSLSSKDIFASHFCYLAAEAEFGCANKASTKMTLLSLRNNYDHLGVNTPNHAILLTQAYEFAKRLQRKDFTIPALVPYKYLLATRLIDWDKSSIALQYLESIAIDQLRLPNGSQDLEVVYNLLELAERIKYSDSKSLVAESSVDKDWLTSLRQLVCQNNPIFEAARCQSGYNDGQFSEQQLHQQPHQTYQSQQPAKQLPQVPMLPSQQMYSVPLANEAIQHPLMLQPQQQPPLQPQPASLPPTQRQYDSIQDPLLSWDMNTYSANSSDIFSPGSLSTAQAATETNPPFNVEESGGHEMQNDFSQVSNSRPAEQLGGYYSSWDQPQQTAQISMHSTSNNYYKENSKPVKVKSSYNNARTQESAGNRMEEQPRPQQSAKREADENSQEKKGESGSSGWFSGLKTKLPFMKSTQAHLPDDKDPPLIYDEQKGRWVDKNKKDDDEVNEIRPPPKAFEMKGFQAASSHNQGAQVGNPLQQGQGAAPAGFPFSVHSSQPAYGNMPATQLQGSGPSMPPASTHNSYKLGGGNMKKNYVNVLAQNKTTPAPNPMMNMYSGAQIPANVNSFVPSSGV